MVFKEEGEKEAKISPEFGYAMILIEQIRRINRVSSFVSSNGWRKEDLQCFINAIKTLERNLAPQLDEYYWNHRLKVNQILKKLDINNKLQRETIYELWGNLFADMMDLCVRRKQLIARGEIVDEL
jgi:hypothetical protein